MISGITQRSLTLQLRELEENGLSPGRYSRTRVEFTLIPFGQTLTPVLAAMKAWGETYIQHRSGLR
jgi:DNA-binding HxlR family transcriptional regulator